MNKLRELFGTRIKAIEIYLLLNDLKPVVRQGFYDSELKKIEYFCKKNSLFLVKSKFKVKPIEQGFSNKGFLSKLDDLHAMTFCYISKDELLANKASYFEIKGDHFNLGLVLGYPKCCAYFFERNFPLQSIKDNNYEIPVIKNSKGQEFSFVLNIFNRHNDYEIISHFPCNLNCEKSIQIGEKYFDFLNKKYPTFSNDLKKNLLGISEKYNDLTFS